MFRDLLTDSLNAMKKDMSKKGGDAGKTQSEASIVFKLFTDLEANDLERASKVILTV